MGEVVFAVRLLSEVGVAVALLRWLAGRANNGWIVWLTLSSFIIRLLIGLGLFLVSFLHLPILVSLQLPGGYWTFATDAVEYASQAHNLQDVGSHLQNGSFDRFPIIIAGIYWAFGFGLPQVLVANALFAAMCVPLAFVAARSLGVTSISAVIAACIVAFWPSSLAWSSQLLKDPLTWLAIFAVVAGVSCLMCTDPKLAPRKLLSWGTVVFGGALLVSLIRGQYTSPAIVGAVLVGIAVSVISARLQHRDIGRLAPVSIVLAAVVLGSIPSYYEEPLNHVGVNAFDVMRAKLSSFFSQPSSGASTANPGPSVETAPSPVSSLGCSLAGPFLRARGRFVTSGGGSQLDSTTRFETCGDVLGYLPRALQLALVGPKPSEWRSVGNSIGPLRYLANIEDAFLWLSLPGLLVALVASFIRPRGAMPILALYVLFLGLALGFVVSNLGTLFRLRLQILLPAFILSLDGWTMIFAWVGAWRPRRRPQSQSSLPLNQSDKQTIGLTS